MNTETRDSNESCRGKELTPDVVFKLLQDRRRRYAFRYLSRKTGATAVPDIAERIALLEGESTPERYTRVTATLYHIHIPLMSDAGVVRYDADRDTVELCDAAEHLVPFLQLTAVHDSIRKN